MKALLVSHKVCEGTMGWIHGQFFNVNRIVVPEANDLAITFHQDSLFVRDGFQIEGGDCKVLKEIEVPDDLVKKAIEYMNLKKELCPAVQEIASVS